MGILHIMNLRDFVKHDTYKCTSITHHRPHRNGIQAPGVFPLGTQGRPISLINDVRFVMRILGVATARCAKLKLRCLIYRRQEDEARARADGKLIATCRLRVGKKTVGKVRELWKRERDQEKCVSPAGARCHLRKRDCVSRLYRSA